jgi:hypothetical protein
VERLLASPERLCPVTFVNNVSLYNVSHVKQPPLLNLSIPSRYEICFGLLAFYAKRVIRFSSCPCFFVRLYIVLSPLSSGIFMICLKKPIWITESGPSMEAASLKTRSLRKLDPERVYHASVSGLYAVCFATDWLRPRQARSLLSSRGHE